MSRLDRISGRWGGAVPGNSEIAIIIDTTRHPHDQSLNAVAAGSAFLIPARMRARYPHVVVNGIIRCTAQDTTAKFYSLTAWPATPTSSDWELDSGAPGAGTLTITASATKAFEWRPSGTEFLFRVDAGGTGPTLFYVEYTVTFTTEFGV